MHECDEARFLLFGQIYYDVYNDMKQIIRIHLVPGDFIIIPKHLFHRTILPQNIESVTFLQMTQNPVTIIPSIDCQSIQSLVIETFFMWNLESIQQKSVNIKKTTTVNGIGYVMGGRAKALACYPHLRAYNGLLFVSGTSSRRPDNTHIGAVQVKNDKTESIWDLDIRAQTRAVFENIKIILGSVGADLQHLLAITVFLVDFKDYNGMNAVYNEYFDGDTGPTRTTVAVARLPHKNLLIEIQCTAAQPNIM